MLNKILRLIISSCAASLLLLSALYFLFIDAGILSFLSFLFAIVAVYPIRQEIFAFDLFLPRIAHLGQDSASFVRSKLFRFYEASSCDIFISLPERTIHHRIALLDVHQEFNGYPVYYLADSINDNESVIFKTIIGISPEITSLDFDGDGIHEMALHYLVGAHTHLLEIFRVHRYDLPSVVRGSNIASDGGPPEWRDDDRDGKYEIYTRTHFSFVDQGESDRHVYVFDGEAYKERSPVSE